MPVCSNNGSTTTGIRKQKEGESMPRWIFGLVAILGVLTLGSIAGFYAFNQARYVESPYAFVTAPYAWVSASSPGIVKQVLVQNGQHVKAKEEVARITTYAGKTLSVLAPRTGTVGSMDVAPGASVGAGQDLMAVVQLAHSQIMAEIPESRARKVALGQVVNVTLSALPGTTLTGRVTHVGSSTLSTLSPLLQVGSFAKEREWIPVTISVNPAGNQLIAGENASVRIHI
ncbi:MAG: biotin attachment protein [Sulfobacillus benefaciens]|uniref:Biotin attachment protein n=1 Tax=Sulfobacillus benefaciens TaxID=453960 RepID=A0A2T2X7Y5_9FIRM|nr:MAG: biotin attachment protein [Sulfobacillus benefaciens]